VVHAVVDQTRGAPPASVRRIGIRRGERELRKNIIMARAGTKILDTGDILPTFAMETVAHGHLTVPDHFDLRWGVLLIYRAHW
jgi:hypothetical protein